MENVKELKNKTKVTEVTENVEATEATAPVAAEAAQKEPDYYVLPAKLVKDILTLLYDQPAKVSMGLITGIQQTAQAAHIGPEVEGDTKEDVKPDADK